MSQRRPSIHMCMIAQAHSSTGGPGGRWGAEFSSAIPSMELFEHEAAEMAVESKVIKDYVTEHTGAATNQLTNYDYELILCLIGFGVN